MCSCVVLNCRNPTFIFWITACYLKVQASCKMYFCLLFLDGELFCRLMYSLSQSAVYAKELCSFCVWKGLQTIYETRIWVNVKFSCSKLLGAFILLYQLFTLTGAERKTSINSPLSVCTLYYKCRFPIPIISMLDFQIP